jgi:alpha-tubulin suppressor-like RCC1 family protein
VLASLRSLVCVPLLACASACIEEQDVGAFRPDAGPPPPDGGTDLDLARIVRPISASWLSTCAIDSAGGVSCWGNNGDGELGVNDTDLPFSLDGPVVAKDLAAGVTTIFGGGDGHCAIRDTNVAECWGKTYYLSYAGTPIYGNSFAPTEQEHVAADTVQLVIGTEWLCLLGRTGKAKCWGIGVSNNLGSGSTDDAFVPHDVANIAGERYVQLATGFKHTCGATGTGGAMCWGSNEVGQLGNSGPDSLVPVAASVSDAVEIAAGDAHNCIRKADGSVWCWGDGASGQLGGAPSTPDAVPITGLPPATTLAAGGAQTCLLTVDGAVWCWGYVGDAVTAPVEVLPASFGATGVAAGGGHACAISASHAVRCWGSNMFGQTNGGSAQL